MKRKKNEFEDGMRPGSRMTMNETSACVTTVVFMYWLKNHFVPRKEPGNVLDFASENDIIQLCVPSDTAQYLRPPFRSFFKPLTTFWQQAVNNWIHRSPSRKITRLQFGRLFHGIRLQQLEMAVRDFQFAEFIRTINNKFLIMKSPYPIVLWTKAIQLQQ